ncbi:hypothetical protein ACFFX1_10320 [Dactylosporangium sucinum]|uniref:ATP/GTP-binding protein n=1 Tax=Dactylosporangium sucinum TaxID=1424081 RepID=A0A917WS24_9ACTN|nr:ATP/GTP-binding protein [Dactylosporangium sucinum]GGM23852.1 ATP/GTP-binding protein [Dactylosporangium sucinum]
MLSRPITAGGVTLAAVAALLVATANPAAADYVYCPPGGGDCYVVVETPGGPGGPGDPGGPGSPGNGGGPLKCTTEYEGGMIIGCLHHYGYYMGEGCFAKLMEPQPPAGDPLWEGHAPGDGAVYAISCGWPGAVQPDFQWRATPPPGFGGLPSPADLAAQAINQLPIRGPIINTAPDAGGTGVVGLPVWIWTPATEATWGPSSRTASVPGLSVTATATASKIVYRMGDGASVTCLAPGTPYTVPSEPVPDSRQLKSPDCGYDGYPAPTPGDSRYTITGTTTWQIHWVGGGQSGDLTVTRTSTATIDIDEIQVITS